ncbi:stage II sporulation protein M [Weizmannia acidilactici]|uniref:stage II sporulation protein M n=1 Tax=Weizmannia acidilactici TaxID=2607726 RepID=UPI00124C0023|nr:stage II sporulation protein M [Weizmannia acidilactici]GER72396.1 stage II sporulation protein M [Weizmannia acidilactici]
MRKQNVLQNPISRHIRENSSIYSFVIVLFLMGVIFGAVIVNSLSIAQKEDLFFYLKQFFGQVSTGKVAAPEDLFRSSFLHNIKFLVLIWVLGISIIGLPLILILLFLKGLVVGFSIGFLVNQMRWGGFLLAFVTVLPQNLLIIPMFIFTSVIAVMFSLNLIRKIFIKQSAHYAFFHLFIKYCGALAAAFIAVLLAACVEAYISPQLMQSVMKIIN